MALINCQNCGKEVSDKAFECPQCGIKLKEKEMPKEICKECGRELESGETICSKCGCPVEVSDNEEVVESKRKILNTKLIIIIAVAIFAIIGIVFGINNAQKKAAEDEKIQISKDYESNLTLVYTAILSGASEAEKAGGLIHDVWYNTIYEKSDSETDQYTKGKYGFNSDFNTSLQNLFDDSDFQSKISSIESNQQTVKSIMKELTNPPEEYEEAYGVLQDYYNAYLDLTNLVINPTGSLQTFTSNYNDADSAVAKYYQAMEVYIE